MNKSFPIVDKEITTDTNNNQEIRFKDE